MRDSLPFSAREMPDGVHTSKRREALLRLPIGDLVTWQLVVSCSGCRADRVLFVRELVERFGEAPTLFSVIAAQSCAAVAAASTLAIGASCRSQLLNLNV